MSVKKMILCFSLFCINGYGQTFQCVIGDNYRKVNFSDLIKKKDSVSCLYIGLNEAEGLKNMDILLSNKEELWQLAKLKKLKIGDFHDHATSALIEKLNDALKIFSTMNIEELDVHINDEGKWRIPKMVHLRKLNISGSQAYRSLFFEDTLQLESLDLEFSNAPFSAYQQKNASFKKLEVKSLVISGSDVFIENFLSDLNFNQLDYLRIQIDYKIDSAVVMPRSLRRFINLEKLEIRTANGPIDVLPDEISKLNNLNSLVFRIPPYYFLTGDSIVVQSLDKIPDSYSNLILMREFKIESCGSEAIVLKEFPALLFNNFPGKELSIRLAIAEGVEIPEINKNLSGEIVVVEYVVDPVKANKKKYRYRCRDNFSLKAKLSKKLRADQNKIKIGAYKVYVSKID
ncbi:MAG: hypothetical protein ACKOXB_12475 [Flavobacteriales bacterium]